MKKLLSTGLLLLFLFNVAGYYLVFWVLHYQACMEMNNRLEAEDYRSDETVTFKVPLAIPYSIDDKEFERVSGSFEHKGEYFKLVKQKHAHDTLIVVCIKDHNEKRLHNAMADFVSLSNDLPVAQKALKILGSFIKDYVPATPVNAQPGEGWYLACGFYPRSSNLVAVDLPILSPPPDLLV